MTRCTSAPKETALNVISATIFNKIVRFVSLHKNVRNAPMGFSWMELGSARHAASMNLSASTASKMIPSWGVFHVQEPIDSSAADVFRKSTPLKLLRLFKLFNLRPNQAKLKVLSWTNQILRLKSVMSILPHLPLQVVTARVQKYLNKPLHRKKQLLLTFNAREIKSFLEIPVSWPFLSVKLMMLQT